MFNAKKEMIDFLSSMIETFEAEGLWYSLFAGTLLGASDFDGKMIPWDDDIDLCITKETYDFLIEHHRDNIVVSNDDGYPLLFPKLVKDKSKMHSSSIFVDLFVVVKTNKIKIKKYRSIKNKMRFGIFSSHHKNYRPFMISIKIFKFLTFLLKPFFKNNLDFNNVYNKLYDQHGDTDMIIANPLEGNRENIIPNFSLERIELLFEDKKYLVMKNYEEYLNHRYNQRFTTVAADFVTNEHIDAYNIRKVKWKKIKDNH